MATKAKTKDKAKDKEARKRRRKGVLADDTRMVRLMVAIVLAVASASLTFTQLGFAGIGMGGYYRAYAVVLLVPVALAALMLGTRWGFLMGLFAGAVLLLHSMVMPLNFYELSYISPLTSIVMLGVSGLLLGLLFRFVLRNDPSSRVKRIIYVAIVCIIVSWLFSIGFIVNVFFQTIADFITNNAAKMPEDQMDAALTDMVAASVFRIGHIGLQAWVDAALMTLFCCVADAAVKKIRALADNKGLRGVFAGGLVVVVALAFMVTTGASFAAVTHADQKRGEAEIADEASYLCTQLKNQSARGAALEKFVESTPAISEGLDDQTVALLTETAVADDLLGGYSKESDGIIVIAGVVDGFTSDDIGSAMILNSDDSRFEVGKQLKDYCDLQMLESMKLSLDSGQVTRTVFDEVDYDAYFSGEEISDHIQSYLAFLTCKKQDSSLVIVAYPAQKVFANREATMAWTTLSVFVLLAAVFLMVFQLLRRVVVDRIDKTNVVLGRITEGDLEARVEERDTREFSSLSDGINTTVDALKGWIAEAESRMDAELATAKAIQESALPRTFPPFPDILKFDVYASMKAAREVGGDFYDFFLIGAENEPVEGKLGFVIADVSGKGVPAALFMMKSMTLIRDYLLSGMEVGEAVDNANRQLCDGNDAGMFVTAWVGVLDYGTGHVEYVNAGHNPPLLWQPSGWQWLMEKSGMPLGLFDGFPYEAFSVDCGIGDEFLLYTDGVTEAMSVDGELYGEERLMALVEKNYTKHPRRLVEKVRADVAKHAKGAEQSDDITILALEVGVPPEITATLIVKADVGNLPRVNEFIHTELDRRLCPKRVQNQLDIAVEELYVNVCHYAYPDATPENPGYARVSYTYHADPPSISVDVADDGIPYNPLEKPDAVTPDNVEDVPIGGLGILMAKRNVNEMTYERVDGSNIVTILKRW